MMIAPGWNNFLQCYANRTYFSLHTFSCMSCEEGPSTDKNKGRKEKLGNRNKIRISSSYLCNLNIRKLFIKQHRKGVENGNNGKNIGKRTKKNVCGNLYYAYYC